MKELKKIYNFTTIAEAIILAVTLAAIILGIVIEIPAVIAIGILTNIANILWLIENRKNDMIIWSEIEKNN